MKDEVNVDVKNISRDDLIELSINAILNVQHKALNGRFKDDKKENLRIQYFKTLNSLIKTLSNLIKDKEIDLLNAEIESLKLSAVNIEKGNKTDDSGVEDVVDVLYDIAVIDERLDELRKMNDLKE